MIRNAIESDIPKISLLLKNVLKIHHKGRPDIFKNCTQKYSDEELLNMIHDPNNPIFVYINNENELLGYAFCNIINQAETSILYSKQYLYIDDLCVDENHRNCNIGSKLFEYIEEYAKSKQIHNIQLNVWSLNQNAINFYNKQGMTPQKTIMEKII